MEMQCGMDVFSGLQGNFGEGREMPDLLWGL